MLAQYHLKTQTEIVKITFEILGKHYNCIKLITIKYTYSKNKVNFRFQSHKNAYNKH